MTDVVDAAEQEYLGRTPVGDAVQTFFYSLDTIAVYAPVYNFRAAHQFVPFAAVGQAVPEEHNGCRIDSEGIEQRCALIIQF